MPLNRRRTLLAVLGSWGAVSGVRGQARPHTPPRIGYFGPPAVNAAHLLAAFRDGLADYGYVDGRTCAVEYRWTASAASMSSEAELRAAARELVERGVDVLAASIDPAILAARQVAGEVPIVMMNATDPVALGLVQSLARPGGRITGLARLSGELAGKNLQLLREAVPQARRVGVPLSAAAPSRALIVASAGEVAQRLGMKLLVREFSTPEDLEAAIARLKRDGADALLFADGGGGTVYVQRARIAELALAARLPTMSTFVESVEAGGLMSYAPSSVANYRRAGYFIDRILRGTPAGEIPVEQPTVFDLVINLKTAKALNVALPQSLLLRAARLIE